VQVARSRGFTLIEAIVVIAVLGIVSVSFGIFILPAIKAQQDVARRAELVDAAEGALRRMARDVRIAVPNSVRLTNTISGGSGFALEMIPTVDGARYCTAGTADCDIAGANVLTINAADTIFDVLGCFRDTAFLAASGGNAYRMVVDNSDTSIYTATGAAAVLTPVVTVSLTLFPGTSATTPACGQASLTANSFNRHRVTLGVAHTFPTGSPRQRVFVVQDAVVPVTYICNQTAGTLIRYAGYKNGLAYSTAAQPTDPVAAPLNAATGREVTRNVTACSATGSETVGSTGTIEGSAVLTINLTLAQSGETVQLMKQVQLDNTQ